MPEIKTTLVLEDKLTKGMKKASDAMEKMGDVSEEAVTKAMKLGQQMEDIGVSADEMTDDFLELNPQLKLYKKLTDEAAKETKELKDQQEKANKPIKGGAVAGGKLTKSLGGMTKGLIGVATAYAGGRAIIGFAKDSLAAADAAGTLPPAIKEASTAIVDLKEVVGTGLGIVLEEPAKALTDIITSHTDVISGGREINKAYEEGKITLEQVEKLNLGFSKSQNHQLDLQKEINKQSAQVVRNEVNENVALQAIINQKLEIKEIDREKIEAQKQIARADAFVLDLQKKNNDALFEELGMTDVLTKAREADRDLLALTSQDLFAIQANLAGLFEGVDIEGILAPVKIKPFFEGLDLDIASQIQSAMASIDFAEAGGRELVEEFGQLFADIDAGKIGADLGQQMFGEMFIQAQQIQVEMGNITADQAAKNIRDTLGVSMQEARTLVNDIENTLKRIGRMKVQARIEFQINTVGDIGTFGQRPGLAGGGSGVVPPGFPNDSFPIGLTSGESFDVRTPAQQASGNGIGSTANLEASIDGMRSDIKNMGQDFLQGVAELIG